MLLAARLWAQGPPPPPLRLLVQASQGTPAAAQSRELIVLFPVLDAMSTHKQVCPAWGTASSLPQRCTHLPAVKARLPRRCSSRAQRPRPLPHPATAGQLQPGLAPRRHPAGDSCHRLPWQHPAQRCAVTAGRPAHGPGPPQGLGQVKDVGGREGGRAGVVASLAVPRRGARAAAWPSSDKPTPARDGVLFVRHWITPSRGECSQGAERHEAGGELHIPPCTAPALEPARLS